MAHGLLDVLKDAFPNKKQRDALLRLAKVDHEDVATPVALRAITDFYDGMGCYVKSEDRVYHYEADATEGEKPNRIDRDDPGRWVPESAEAGQFSTGCVGVEGASGTGGYVEGSAQFIFSVGKVLKTSTLSEAFVALTLGDGAVYDGSTEDVTVRLAYIDEGESVFLTLPAEITDTPEIALTLIDDVEIPADTILYSEVSAGEGRTFYGQVFAKTTPV